MLTFNSKIYEEERQVHFLRKSIKDIKHYINNLKETTNAKNAYRLKKAFYNKMGQTSKGLLSNSNIKVDLMRIDSIEYLLLNFTELEEIYNKIIKEEEKNGKDLSEDDLDVYSSVIEENKINAVKENILLLRDAIHNMNNFEDKTMLVKLSLMSKKQRDVVLKKVETDMGIDKRKHIEQVIKIYRTPEFDLLKEHMRDFLNDYREELKKEYIDSLGFIGKFLKDFDLIKNYVDSNMGNLQKIRLGRMRCNQEELETMFTKEYLENLSIEQLTYLNVFWLNKFTKEMDNISKAAFVINDFDLWDDIYEGKETKFSYDELKWELIKMDTLANFENQCLEDIDDNPILREMVQKAIQNEEAKREMIENNTIKLDFSKYIKQIEFEEGAKYKEVYSSKLPRSKNIFSHEVDYFKSTYITIENAYELKDMALMGILDNLQLNSNIQNWGIMKQLEDTRLLNTRYILIGVDLPGMNMPIRLHIPKDLLIDCVAKNNKLNVIPLYAGSNDFYIEIGNDSEHSRSVWITSSILMPTTQEQKANIIQKAEDYPNNLYNHLAYVYGAKDFPEHLETEIIKPGRKGKKIVKKVFKRQFVKADTCEILSEDDLERLEKEITKNISQGNLENSVIKQNDIVQNVAMKKQEEKGNNVSGDEFEM